MTGNISVFYQSAIFLHSIIYFLIVADMCKSISATEERNAGSYRVDRVVLRIMMQQENCICRVTIAKYLITTTTACTFGLAAILMIMSV
jgi:hypothetical protein